MHADRLLTLMEPYQDNVSGFVSALGIQVTPEAEDVLKRIEAARDGGTVGVPNDERALRAVLLGMFWWSLRKEGSLVVVGCPNQHQINACMGFLHSISHRIAARIAEHVTFPRANRIRIAGSTSWGMVFELEPQVGHFAPHLAVLEVCAEQFNRRFVNERDDILRVSTWNGPART